MNNYEMNGQATTNNTNSSKRPQIHSSYIQQHHNHHQTASSASVIQPKQQKSQTLIKKPKLIPESLINLEHLIGIDSFEGQNQNNVFVISEDYVLVTLEMKSRSMFCFKGRCSVALLHGCLGISGYNIQRHSSTSNHPYKWHDLYSPETNSFLTITNKATTNNSHDPQTLQNQISHITGGHHLQLPTLTQFLQNSSSLFIIRPINNSTICNYLSYIDNFKKIYLEKVNNDCLGQMGVFPVSSQSYESSIHVVGCEENKVCEQIGEKGVNNGGGLVVMACGGKDVGKSTFLRYLVNSLLNKHKSVAYLDCDPGQAEFTLSGCISLTIITSPLFGPPHTHLTHTPNTTAFFGHLSPSDTPAHYLACIRHCYQAFLAIDTKSNEKIPLVVNTMGWNQGLGLCLLKDILLEVKPTFIVQINHCLDVGKNMPVLDRKWLNGQEAASIENKFKSVRMMERNDNWRQPVQTRPITDLYSHITYTLLSLKSNSPKPNKTKQSHHYSSKDHRTIATISYFATLQQTNANNQNFQSIHNLRPYKVSWSKFALHCSHVKVDFKQMFRVFNASLVGMCIVDDRHIRNQGVNKCSQFRQFDEETKKPVVYTCLGFGIIRGINMETKEFYILTPINIDLLDRVNLLVKGMLNLPAEFMYEQDSTTCSPYMSLADNLQTHKENMIGNEPVQRKYLIH